MRIATFKRHGVECAFWVSVRGRAQGSISEAIFGPPEETLEFVVECVSFHQQFLHAAYKLAHRRIIPARGLLVLMEDLAQGRVAVTVSDIINQVQDFIEECASFRQQFVYAIDALAKGLE